MPAWAWVMTVMCSVLGVLCILGFWVSRYDDDGVNFVIALMGCAFIAGPILVDTGTICSDVACRYAYMTTGRVARFCAPHGGVKNVQWGDDTAICGDGTLQAFYTGYYHPGQEPRP